MVLPTNYKRKLISIKTGGDKIFYTKMKKLFSYRHAAMMGILFSHVRQ